MTPSTTEFTISSSSSEDNIIEASREGILVIAGEGEGEGEEEGESVTASSRSQASLEAREMKDWTKSMPKKPRR